MNEQKHNQESPGSERTEAEIAADEVTAQTHADDKDAVETRLRRAMADLANFRRRQAKELDDARKRAIETLAVELLPVVDNFHLALDSAEGADDPAAVLEGVELVRTMLIGVLERHGLTEIRAQGTRFDPMRHEAIGVDAETTAEPGVVTKVVQRGYTLGERVVRASRVLVSGPVEAQDTGAERAD